MRSYLKPKARKNKGILCVDFIFLILRLVLFTFYRDLCIKNILLIKRKNLLAFDKKGTQLSDPFIVFLALFFIHICISVFIYYILFIIIIICSQTNACA